MQLRDYFVRILVGAAFAFENQTAVERGCKKKVYNAPKAHGSACVLSPEK
jgi:hypothetical protein